MLRLDRHAKMQQKLDSTPASQRRDALTDYREGYFFVTLNTRGEAPILSTVVGRVGGTGEDAPHCCYTEMGQRVLAVWQSIPQFHPYVELLGIEAMPEHMHGLLRLKPGGREHLGRIINGFMIACTHEYWDVLGIDWRSMKKDPRLGDAAVSQYQDRDHTRSYRGPALFVHGYNDVEALTPEQLQIKVEYIQKQAEKRLIRGDRHECFRVYREQRTACWNTNILLQALASDPYLSSNADERQKAWTNVQARLLGGNAPYLDHVGNRQLLLRECLLPLIVHRADAHRFEEQRQATLDAARKGAIIVSAFISPKENEIRHQLMLEQLPFIEIIDNGFPERYKPVGKPFYACAENRLLQFSCWTYIYQRSVKVKREMCLVMNQLARVICKRDEGWWKK